MGGRVLKIGDAAQMNASAYEETLEAMPHIEGWRCVDLLKDTQSGVSVARWEAQSGHVYLAVRGTATGRDVLENMRLFLGRDPTSRMEFFRNYVQTTCAKELAADCLAMGGHSLGGLLALDAAAHWSLPALIQNAPGWISHRPNAPRLERVLEIRTGRDVVGDWGHAAPRNIVLQDPLTPWWHLAMLHAVMRQNDIIRSHGLGDVLITDERFNPRPLEDDAVKPGLAGWPQRMCRAWNRLREQQDLARLHRVLSGEAPPPRRRPKP